MQMAAESCHLSVALHIKHIELVAIGVGKDKAVVTPAKFFRR